MWWCLMCERPYSHPKNVCNHQNTRLSNGMDGKFQFLGISDGEKITSNEEWCFCSLDDVLLSFYEKVMIGQMKKSERMPMYLAKWHSFVNKRMQETMSILILLFKWAKATNELNLIMTKNDRILSATFVLIDSESIHHVDIVNPADQSVNSIIGILDLLSNQSRPIFANYNYWRCRRDTFSLARWLPLTGGSALPNACPTGLTEKRCTMPCLLSSKSAIDRQTLMFSFFIRRPEQYTCSLFISVRKSIEKQMWTKNKTMLECARIHLVRVQFRIWTDFLPNHQVYALIVYRLGDYGTVECLYRTHHNLLVYISLRLF